MTAGASKVSFSEFSFSPESSSAIATPLLISMIERAALVREMGE